MVELMNLFEGVLGIISAVTIIGMILGYILRKAKI